MDWKRIEGFEWDHGNARMSGDKHGASQTEAEQVFFNEPLLIAEDQRHSEQEPRRHVLGRTDEGRPLHVIFTLRGAGTRIRVISARRMSRKEKARYGQEN
jgi:uncharacterized protein